MENLNFINLLSPLRYFHLKFQFKILLLVQSHLLGNFEIHPNGFLNQCALQNQYTQ